jgi:membrane associated rhomboid family serine protease
LSVVCRSCGEEVSTFVTECSYCGARLRKRAPKLERHGDEIVAHESRRVLRKRRRDRRAAEGRALGRVAERPLATLGAILGPALLLLVQRAADISPVEVGAIVGAVGSEWWRYLAAPWVFDDVGYLFVVAFAVALFVPALERRLGTLPTVVLLLAAGALGMLGAAAASELGVDDPLVAAGGNGVALGALGAWYALRQGDARRRGEADFDLIAVAVIAVVLLALPLVESFASPIAGLIGALVGLVAGTLASVSGRAADA